MSTIWAFGYFDACRLLDLDPGVQVLGRLPAGDDRVLALAAHGRQQRVGQALADAVGGGLVDERLATEFGASVSAVATWMPASLACCSSGAIESGSFGATISVLTFCWM
jgi:hypothetical protein